MMSFLLCFCDVMMSCDVMSYGVIPMMAYFIVSFNLMSYHAIQFHGIVMLRCLVITCHIMAYCLIT